MHGNYKKKFRPVPISLWLQKAFAIGLNEPLAKRAALCNYHVQTAKHLDPKWPDLSHVTTCRKQPHLDLTFWV